MNIKKFIDARIERIKNHMSKNGIDVAIISRPENVFYFSNFNPVLNSHPAYFIVSLKNESCLLVHCIRNDHAREEGSIDNIELYGKWGANVALALDPIDAIKIIIGDESINIGIERDYASLNFLDKLNPKLNIVSIQDLANEISQMKTIKDEYEIDCIRKSAHLVDSGVKTVIDFIKQGYSEARACTEGQYKMRQLWHELYSEHEVCGFGTSEGGQIDSIVAWSMANERIAYGCDCPREYVPVSGDLVLPMAWAKISGYSAENERVIIIDETDSLKTKAYDSMLKARENVFRLLKPGTVFEDLYFAAVKVFDEYGFGNILPGRIGHGIGLSAHEFPSLTKGNKMKLSPGMVFTVEPGLMTKDWGGVRHSDTVVITEDGFEFLTKLENGKIIISKE